MRALPATLAAVSLSLPASVLLGASGAYAHDDEGHARHFPGARLEPPSDVYGIANTEWAGVPDHFGWDLALWFGYENDPLFTFAQPDGAPGRDPLERDDLLVADRLHAHVVGAVALFNWFQLGLDAPVLLVQGRDDALAPELDRAEALGATGFGDIMLRPKIRVLRQMDGAPFDIAFLAPVSFPSGQFTDYYGEETTTIAPGIAFSREWTRFRFAANVMHRFRAPSRVFSLSTGNELVWRAAVGYTFQVVQGSPTELGVGVSGFAATDSLFRGDNSPTRNPVEALVDVQHKVFGPVDVFFGGGVGIISGFGVPDFRVLAGVRVGDHPTADYDGDGLAGSADRCPRVPENFNQWEDDDGCPDAGDDDKDGISNTTDKCVSVPEDKDGVEDGDGCPEDDDKDGILDVDDKCRTVPEDKDEFEDGDGCPENDNDKDGILDESDKCKLDPEDKDGWQDDDGCPEADNDADSLTDANDLCPNEAGPLINKGCPDRDRDGDTVVDRLDNCPDEAGTPENGGCKAVQLVVITETRLEIKDRVYFKTNKDIIEKKSFGLLDNVAAVIKAHPEIKKIRVEGHTDTDGTPEKNMDLSDRRAKSVMKYLVETGGVDAARLEAQGYGQTRPVATNDTPEGKQENRRVEFVILENEGAAVPLPADGQPAPAPAPTP